MNQSTLFHRNQSLMGKSALEVPIKKLHFLDVMVHFDCFSTSICENDKLFLFA